MSEPISEQEAQAIFAEASKELADQRSAGEAPAPAPTAAAAPVEPQQPQAQGDTPADPPAAEPAPLSPEEQLLAGLKEDDPIRKVVNHFIERTSQLERQVKAANGRYGALVRETQQHSAKLAEVATARAQQGTLTVGNVDALMAKLDEDPEFKQLAEDYPDIARMQRRSLKATLSGLVGAQGEAAPEAPPKTTPQAMPAQPSTDSEALARVARLEAEAEIGRALKGRDWIADINTPEFAKWLDTQPSYAKRVVTDGETAETIDLLQSFYRTRDKRPTATPQAERLKTAAEPRGQGVATADIEPDSPEAIFKAESERRARARLQANRSFA